ncbi:MAG: hypothetical protein M0Q40_12630 [Limnochordia bacterium]|nr:hypothetical protein [Limnochordia bacterium]MDD4519026.1 hypothetical protein [Limnochordia bacterium]
MKWINDIRVSILEAEAMIHLDKGLHAIQDISAHADKFVDSLSVLGITVYHHLGPKGKGADKAGTPRNPEPRVLEAQEATKDYLTRFRTGVGLQ